MDRRIGLILVRLGQAGLAAATVVVVLRSSLAEEAGVYFTAWAWARSLRFGVTAGGERLLLRLVASGVSDEAALARVRRLFIKGSAIGAVVGVALALTGRWIESITVFLSISLGSLLVERARTLSHAPLLAQAQDDVLRPVTFIGALLVFDAVLGQLSAAHMLVVHLGSALFWFVAMPRLLLARQPFLLERWSAPAERERQEDWASSLPFAVADALAAVSLAVTLTVLLRFPGGAEAAAVTYVIQRIVAVVEMPQVAMSALVQSEGPALARSGNRRELQALAKRSSRAPAAFATLAFGAVAVASGPLLEFFGAEASSGAVAGLIVVGGVSALTVAFGQTGAWLAILAPGRVSTGMSMLRLCVQVGVCVLVAPSSSVLAGPLAIAAGSLVVQGVQLQRLWHLGIDPSVLGRRAVWSPG